MKNDLIENRQIRVFISSTFQDMNGERDHLMKHVFPRLRAEASRRDVTLTELDLRWGITEDESQTGKVVDICLREIDNSIPFFIGIIGNRYGWVPSVSDLSEGTMKRFPDVSNYLERRLSVTDMEMQHGVLRRKDKVHAYFYMKEQEGEQDNPGMLRRLKDEVIASGYPYSKYSSVENLASQVESAFMSLLDELFPEVELSELEKARVGQRSFMRRLCKHYISDENNFRKLDEWFADRDRQCLVVTGASGLGKSALIANWVREKIEGKDRDYNIICHFTGNGGSECGHEYIKNLLCEEIEDIYGWKADDESQELKELSSSKDDMSESGSKDDRLNDLFLKVASEKKPLLIVLDAVNQIHDADEAKLLNWLPMPPRNIRILYSTLEDDRTMEVFKRRKYDIFTLLPLDINQRTELVKRYLKELYGKSLTDAQVKRIVEDQQCENTLVLKTLLDELLKFGAYELLDKRIDYFLKQDTIEDFYQTLLKSYEDEFGEYGGDMVRQVISLIAVSRAGLSESDILEMTKIKPLHWSQFYCSFISHMVNKDGMISFSHKYISDAVWQRYLINKEDEDFFRDEIIALLTSTEQEHPDSRIWTELPHQYFHKNDIDSLYIILQNLSVFLYLEDKHKPDLVIYWKKLIAEGYKPDVYKEILKAEKNNDKKGCGYNRIGNFFSDYFAMYDFVLSINKNHVEWALNTYGENHFETAASYNNIGFAFSNICDYTKALEYFEKALAIHEKVFGTDHSDKALSYNNIGLAFSNIGDYTKALEYFKMYLSIIEKILGVDHPDTALSYNNIGTAYSDLGDYPKALEYYEKSLAIREKVLGVDHPNTADSYNNIGTAYSDLGDYPKALEYYEKALAIREKVLGVEHPDTAGSYNNLGIVYNNMGEYPKALEYKKKALAFREKVLGTDHPDTATSYNNIGNVYSDMGDYPKALEYLEKALAVREKVLGVEHPDTANSYNIKGNVYYYMCDYTKALEYYEKALAIKEKVLGVEHPDTAGYYNNFGNIYGRMGDYPKSLEYHLKSLAIREKVLGVEHPDTADSYNNIGIVYSNMGDYTKALEYFKMSLSIREKVLGVEHPNTAELYDNVGNVYGRMRNYHKALEYHNKAIEISEKVLGTDHPYTADSYNNIAWTYHLMGKYEEALPWAEKAVSIQPIWEYIDTLATVYQRLGQYQEALEQFELCLKLKHEHNAPEESIKETEEKIEELKLLIS